MVSQNLTVVNGLAPTVVFSMRWENIRTSQFFWCWCNQTFRCFTVVAKSIPVYMVLVPIKCLGRKSGAQNRECPKGRAAETLHSLGSRRRSACGGALETGNVLNVISSQGWDASYRVVRKCFSHLRLSTLHLSSGMAPLLSSNAEAGTDIKI